MSKRPRKIGSVSNPIVIDDTPEVPFFRKKLASPVVIDLSRDTSDERALTLKELDEKYGKRPRVSMVIVIDDDTTVDFDDNPGPKKKMKATDSDLDDSSDDSSEVSKCDCNEKCVVLPSDCQCVTEYCNCPCHRCSCGRCHEKCEICDELECICNLEL